MHEAFKGFISYSKNTALVSSQVLTFHRDVLGVEKSLDLVGHVMKSVTLVIDRVGRRYTSHHVIT